MTAPSPNLSTFFQWVRPHKKYVYYFSEGNSEDKSKKNFIILMVRDFIHFFIFLFFKCY